VRHTLAKALFFMQLIIYHTSHMQTWFVLSKTGTRQQYSWGTINHWLSNMVTLI